MKEIKLIVDGKEVKLTEEQIKVLGFEVEKNHFERCKDNEKYFYLDSKGKVYNHLEAHDKVDNMLYLVANYCTDKELMTKRAKQEVLNRLLWRFSMENGWDDSLWEDTDKKYCVFFGCSTKEYLITYSCSCKIEGAVYFKSREIAQRAIDEIIIPFEKGKLEVCKIWEE